MILHLLALIVIICLVWMFRYVIAALAWLIILGIVCLCVWMSFQPHLSAGEHLETQVEVRRATLVNTPAPRAVLVNPHPNH